MFSKVYRSIPFSIIDPFFKVKKEPFFLSMKFAIFSNSLLLDSSEGDYLI